MIPELGTIVGGKYRILRVLGEGGMGAVYEAENVLTLKRAAIKWLHPQVLPSEEGYLRVLHEARASARIRHRNVVDVYDVVREADSIFLVMELLLGEALSAHIARGGLTMHGYVSLLLPAMHGVAAAHAVGVVHRDIKPENIFLVNEQGQREPTPKVIDFGISKLIEPDGAPHLTRSGITMGTPKYVSYEQLAGARDVDARADVYAVGVMLYEALIGRPPYDATSFGQQAIRFATTVPRTPRELRPEVPAILDAVVMRAIARDREERFPSMNALIAALEPFSTPALYDAPLKAFPERSAETSTLAMGHALTTTPVYSTPEAVPSARLPSPSPMPQVTTHRERGRLFVRGALAMLPVVLLGLGFVLWSLRSEPTAPGAAPSVSTTPPPSPLELPVPAASLPRVEPALEPEPSVHGPDEATAVSEPRKARTSARARAQHGSITAPLLDAVVAPAPDAGVRARRTEQTDPNVPIERQTHRAGRVTRDQF